MIKIYRIFQISALVLAVLLLGSCAALPKNQQEYSSTEFLLDTVCTIRAGGNGAEDAVHEAFAAVKEVATLTDYYSGTSMVAQINQTPADLPILLDDQSLKMFQTALDVCENSGGALDITVAPVTDLWDFKSDSPQLPSPDELETALAKVGYSQLELDAENRTLTKTSSDVKVDLGGVAKGYAADRAAAVLKGHSVSFAVIDLGGNVYVLGTNPKTGSSTFRVGIQKPFAQTGTYAQTVDVSDGAVVTSGSYQRNFTIDGKLYHHILNPKTGYPAESGVSGASVISGSALLADCLSTACFVLGEGTGDELARHYNAKILWEK